MPPDIEVYKLTAGGVRELMDEWTDQAKATIQEALKKHLGNRYGFEMKFISRDWLKENHKDLWFAHKALYNAVSLSAYKHAFALGYRGIEPFRTKIKNFDYSLGVEVGELAKACGADALLFIYGYDHIPTAGRSILLFWNIMVGAVTGVTYVPINPSALTAGLVFGETGDLEWFKITPPNAQYNFRNQKNMDYLIEWITRDMLPQK